MHRGRAEPEHVHAARYYEQRIIASAYHLAAAARKARCQLPVKWPDRRGARDRVHH